MHAIIITDKGYHDLNPVQFGYQDCPPLHYYGPAVRTHWLIHFVLSGEGIFRIGEKEYTVKENDIFVIPPYTETYYEASADAPWHYIWIGFTAGEHIAVNLPSVLHAPELRNIFLSMKTCENHESTRSSFLAAKLWEMFSQVQKEHSPTTDYIDNALTYIHAEYTHNISVEEIASRLKLERTYFSTLFKKRTGLSPKQYIVKYRMENAALLMTKNHSSVSVAANSVGYTDIFNFSKMFKQHFGISPSEYIKQKK